MSNNRTTDRSGANWASDKVHVIVMSRVAAEAFADCGGPYDLTPAHSISSWESQPTTCAEDAVIRYLSESGARFAGKTLLHVGIGNGALFASIGSSLRNFTGLTISRPEIIEFRNRFSDESDARVILANKHDERTLALIGDAFDIVVDVNLKSFACCEKHFKSTMHYFADSLTPGGMIITAQSGLAFGWAGNTAVAFTPGADTNPVTSAQRILGVDGLVRLGIELGLRVDSFRVEPSVAYEAETLWVLKKD